MVYFLQIVFKSNERPWRTDRYEHYPRKINRETAVQWARDMQEGLGDYQVTLYSEDEDGVITMINHEPNKDECDVASR